MGERIQSLEELLASVLQAASTPNRPGRDGPTAPPPPPRLITLRAIDAPTSFRAQVATIGDAIEKITHTGAHAADAKVEPGAPASGSPKVVEGEVVKPPPS